MTNDKFLATYMCSYQWMSEIMLWRLYWSGTVEHQLSLYQPVKMKEH